MSWYALFVRMGSEETVQEYLRYHYSNIYSVVPMRKILEKRNGRHFNVLKKLFPGYVLLNTEMDTDKYHVISSIPKLIRILGDGEGSCIDEKEIEVILKLIGSDGIIDYSKVYIENSIVHVEDGPLKGFECMIKKINKHTNRAKIQVMFMGEPRTVDMGIEMLYADNGRLAAQ